MNAFHFQEGFITERLQGVFPLAKLFFHLSLPIWFRGGCRSPGQHRPSSWVKCSCQCLLKNTRTLQPDVFWVCPDKEVILTLQKPLGSWKTRQWSDSKTQHGRRMRRNTVFAKDFFCCRTRRGKVINSWSLPFVPAPEHCGVSKGRKGRDLNWWDTRCVKAWNETTAKTPRKKWSSLVLFFYI